MSDSAPRTPGPSACGVPGRLLSRFHDGEVHGSEEAELRRHLADCGRCAARLRLLASQRQLLRDGAEARAASIDLTGFADRVMAAVAVAPRPSRVERFPVVSLEQWRRRKGLLSAVAGFAAAASLLFTLLGRHPAEPPVAEAIAQASVDLLEVEGPAGMVIERPGQTTVIWVNDDEATR